MARSSDTKQRLIAAAVGIIEDGGVSRLRLRDVAAAVGIQEPSIYSFFANRDALVVEASAARYQRGLLDLSAVFAAMIASATNQEEFRTAVRTCVAATFGEERAPYRAARIGVLELARTRPKLAERLLVAQREADEQLGAAIRSAAERGWVRTDVDPVVLARWIIALINGRVFLELDPAREGATDWDRLTTEAVLHLMAGGTSPEGAAHERD
jgi:AcrR family transcriptional regulator